MNPQANPEPATPSESSPPLEPTLDLHRVAALQMVSTPRVAENLHICDEWAARAAMQGVKLLLLPEYFPIMTCHEDERFAAAEDFGNGPIQDFLAKMAVRHALWLIAGSIPLRAEEGKLFNSLLVYNPQGKVVARYDKIHLFSFETAHERYNEGLKTAAGKLPVAVDTPFGRIGLSVCYDLRFPELYRALGTLDLIVVPAAFTATTGRDHWEILLRARAIENQCFLLAAAQGGQHESGRETFGHSMLLDPWGKIIAQRSKGQGLVIGELDPARLVAIRQQLPALTHRVLS